MKISDAVMAELSIADVSADGLRISLARRVDRKLYKATNDVLTALGGRWSRYDGAHVFTEDARSRLEGALTSGDVTTDAELGFFETPEELARRLVSLADVRRGDLCLEPSAGSGRIVAELLDVGANVVAVEREANRRRRLDAIEAEDDSLSVVQLDDFITLEPSEPFDRVVMNPPFLRCGLGDHLDHVRHAYALLIPGGVLVSVLPSGVRFRQDRRYREFREWVEARGTFTDLPEGSFKASGTGVNTCVARLVGR
jgi:predicted RNA methylase